MVRTCGNTQQTGFLVEIQAWRRCRPSLDLTILPRPCSENTDQ